MRALIWIALFVSCKPEVPDPESRFPSIDPGIRLEMLTPGPGRLEVVIDTDLTNEIDDEFALSWALLSPERLDVAAVYAAPHAIWPELLTTGTSTLDQRILLEQLASLGLEPSDIPATDPADGMEAAFEAAEQLLALHRSDVPAFRGAPAYLPDATTPVPSAAVDDLIARAREDREGPLFVVSLGAPTNIASALLTAPDIVDDIVVVWTSAYPTFWPHQNASFNLAQDVHASRLLFESGVPMVYLPGFYVGEELRVTLPEMAEYVEGRGPVGGFLYEIYQDHPLIGDHYARSKVLWDLICVAWLLDPTWLETRLVSTPTLDVELRWQAVPGAPRMLQAEDVWRDALFEDLYTKLANQAPE